MSLSPGLTERVLERLGLSRAPAPELAGLRDVYDAWCRRVPFDDVRKRIHVASGATAPLPDDEPMPPPPGATSSSARTPPRPRLHGNEIVALTPDAAAARTTRPDSRRTIH